MNDCIESLLFRASDVLCASPRFRFLLIRESFFCVIREDLLEMPEHA